MAISTTIKQNKKPEYISMAENYDWNNQDFKELAANNPKLNKFHFNETNKTYLGGTYDSNFHFQHIH